MCHTESSRGELHGIEVIIHEFYWLFNREMPGVGAHEPSPSTWNQMPLGWSLQPKGISTPRFWQLLPIANVEEPFYKFAKSQKLKTS